MRTGTPTVVGKVKTCFRCGAEFTDFSEYGTTRKCAKCKQPRQPQKSLPASELLGMPLTVREIQVVRGVCDALLNKEIAEKLHIGEGTIKVYVSTIFAKLGVSNRTALAISWIRSHREEFFGTAKSA